MWAPYSLRLQVLARENFDLLTPGEYAATSLMNAMWLFSKPEVLPGKRDYLGKLRLLLLSHTLIAVIEDERRRLSGTA